MKIFRKLNPGPAVGAALAAALASTLIAMPAAVHATALGDLAATMQPGQWKKLNTNGFGDGAILVPHGGDGIITEYTDEALRNPITKKIYIVGCVSNSSGGGGYKCSSSDDQDARFVEYDEIANSWKDMPNMPVKISPHSYDHAALDPATGDYYYRVASLCEVWRLSGGKWSQLPNIPDGCSYNIAAGLEFFPELGGIVYAGMGSGGQPFIFLYKPGSNAWSSIPVNQPLGAYHNATEYSAKRKVLYLMGGEDNPDYGANEKRVLLILDAQGKVKRAADAPADMGQKIAVNTVDPITGNFVLFANDGSTYEYNPDSDTWKRTGSHSLLPVFEGDDDMFHVAVPVPEHGVIFAIQGAPGGATASGATNAVWLYKHSAGAPPAPDTTAPQSPLGVKAQ